MSAKYDFYKNPKGKDSSKATCYHPRIVTNQTVNTDELANKIHSRCSMTTADVKGVLASLTEVIIQELKDGNRIYIEGLGYLQLTLTCPPIKSVNEINAQSIEVKSVAFRPEINLKNELKDIQLKRAEIKAHSREYSPDEVNEILTDFFQKQPSINRNDFEHLFSMTRTTANRRLKQLVDEGKLQNVGLKRFPTYQPAEGFFGK